MDKYQVRLLEKKEIAQNTWAFSFEKPSDFAFLPGQFTTITVQLSNGRKDSRDFTIASSPLDENISIVTKVEQQRSSFKQALSVLSIGQEVEITKPAGGFGLRDEKPHIFLAGGIGITPFYSMLKFASQNEIKIPLTLFVSFSKEEEIVFYEELKQLNKQNMGLVYSLTNTSNKWEGEIGRISEKMIRKYIQDISDTIFMIAGPVGMVDEMQAMLLQMGVPSGNIKIDYFTGY